MAHSQTIMTQKSIADFDLTDSEEDLVVPSPPAVRRSSRIQCRDSPWVQWPSEKIINTLEAQGIPLNSNLSKDDLPLLASNTLDGSLVTPANPLPTSPTPSAQPKLAGRKTYSQVVFSQSSQTTIPISSSPPSHGSADINSQLIQVIHSFSETVKGLDSRLKNVESASAKCAPGFSSGSSPALTPLFRPCDLSAVPSTSSATTAAALPTAQIPGSDTRTVVPAQTSVRRFVPPAAVTVSPLLRTNIIQGKDINLATLLLLHLQLIKQWWTVAAGQFS